MQNWRWSAWSVSWPVRPLSPSAPKVLPHGRSATVPRASSATLPPPAPQSAGDERNRRNDHRDHHDRDQGLVALGVAPHSGQGYLTALEFASNEHVVPTRRRTASPVRRLHEHRAQTRSQRGLDL